MVSRAGSTRSRPPDESIKSEKSFEASIPETKISVPGRDIFSKQTFILKTFQSLKIPSSVCHYLFLDRNEIPQIRNFLTETQKFNKIYLICGICANSYFKFVNRENEDPNWFQL